jgi:hypothetical protein
MHGDVSNQMVCARHDWQLTSAVCVMCGGRIRQGRERVNVDFGEILKSAKKFARAVKYTRQREIGLASRERASHPQTIELRGRAAEDGVPFAFAQLTKQFRHGPMHLRVAARQFANGPVRAEHQPPRAEAL